MLSWLFGFPAIFNILDTILKIVSPVFKGLFEFLVWYIKELGVGLKDMVDNLSSIIFVLTVAGIAGLYGFTLMECADPATLIQGIPLPTKSPISPPVDWDPFGIWP